MGTLDGGIRPLAASSKSSGVRSAGLRGQYAEQRPSPRSQSWITAVLISRRYEREALILTSNRSFSQRNKIFGDTVIATAILDRILHHSTTIIIKGSSYRLKEKVKDELMRSPELDKP